MNITRLSFFAAAIGVVLSAGVAQGDPARAAFPVPKIGYTAPQAARGKLAYLRTCGRCHGGDLVGTSEIPTLQGRFVEHWSGGSLNEVVDYIRTAMPIDKPGSMDQKMTVEIMAYLLQSNGFPAGDVELPTDPAALAKIRLMPMPAGQR